MILDLYLITDQWKVIKILVEVKPIFLPQSLHGNTAIYFKQIALLLCIVHNLHLEPVQTCIVVLVGTPVINKC